MKRAILTTSLAILMVAGAVWGQDAKKPVTEKQVTEKTKATASSTSASEKKSTTQAAAKPVSGKDKKKVEASTPAPQFEASTGIVTVESVTGSASKCNTVEGTNNWTPVKAGDKLNELMLIRTGLGSEVVLVFEDRAKFTVKSASKIGIAAVRKSDGVYQAQLGLKYGAMKASIDRSKGENDFRVATPVGALAVKGSRANFAFNTDRGFGIHSNQSVWHVRNNNNGSRNVPQGGRTNSNLDSTNQILTQKLNTHVGDPFGGLTPEEQNALNVNGGGRAIFDFVGSSGDFGGAAPSPPSRNDCSGEIGGL
jgi:hypothetical protein